MADVVQPLNDAQISKLTNLAVQRILKSEKAIARSGMSHVSLNYSSSSIGLSYLSQGSQPVNKALH